MNTAVLDSYLGEFTFQKISKIQKPYPVSSFKLQKFTIVIEHLTVLVEQQWDKLPDLEREALIAIVYDAIESSEKEKNIILNFWRRISFAWMLINSGEESFVAYRNAVQRFINSVLDKVERSHPEYELQVSQALQEVLEDSQNSLVMTQDEFEEWLSNL
ncbi:hypothetical protein [Spirulina sp. 06S082]|uniref:hypothetical protein n=1 Tax=Spirulina sp. 06S082 TaxID=3110248 RepID=UPI002B205944|nr:hypothetical protein [Spirulina sp. 06S082]MEA5471497.1 hypothetical protein [Spirulina sp. 06S082]